MPQFMITTRRSGNDQAAGPAQDRLALAQAASSPSVRLPAAPTSEN